MEDVSNDQHSHSGLCQERLDDRVVTLYECEVEHLEISCEHLA